MSRPRVLLLLAGEPAPELAQTAGDYAAWFRDALGESVILEAVAAFAGVELPDARAFDGVLMSGSPLSVTDYDREPWMPRAGQHMLAAADAGVPVLGVCFGHQLLARAAGGRVEKNPHGREIGTIEVALTDEGRRHDVLGPLPGSKFQSTHVDAVTALPPGAQLLAESDFGIQAFSLGPKVLAVQFHPELDARRMAALIDSRAEPLRAEGIYERVRSGVVESAAGRALLAGWAKTLRR